MADTYKHRSVDADGNPDDKFTEEEALEMAKAEGIEFVDTFLLVDETLQPLENHSYDTLAKAQKALAKLEEPKGVHVMQRRERK